MTIALTFRQAGALKWRLQENLSNGEALCDHADVVLTNLNAKVANVVHVHEPNEDCVSWPNTIGINDNSVKLADTHVVVAIKDRQSKNCVLTRQMLNGRFNEGPQGMFLVTLLR